METTAALVELFSGSGLACYNIMYINSGIFGSVNKTMSIGSMSMLEFSDSPSS
jgi:hypothetical protein